MRIKIRILFILILPVLFLQMYYCHHNPEPFPAIMMPRFGHQQTAYNTISYEDADLFFIATNGEKQEIDRHELFENMHLPQRVFAVKKVFSPGSEAKNDVEFLDWLRARMRTLTGSERGTLEIIWHKVYLKKDKNKLGSKKENIDIKTIDF